MVREHPSIYQFKDRGINQLIFHGPLSRLSPGAQLRRDARPLGQRTYKASLIELSHIIGSTSALFVGFTYRTGLPSWTGPDIFFQPNLIQTLRPSLATRGN